MTERTVDEWDALIQQHLSPEVGDICPVCKKPVAEKMSGISCPCGVTWFCY